MNNEEIKLPDITVCEGEHLDAGQAARLTAVIKLTHLLKQITNVMERIGVVVIQSEGATPEDLSIVQGVERSAEKVKDALRVVAKHHEQCVTISEKQIEVSKTLLAMCSQARRAVPDEELEKRATKLLELLDRIEKHKQSGLLEAVSKL